MPSYYCSLQRAEIGDVGDLLPSRPVCQIETLKPNIAAAEGRNTGLSAGALYVALRLERATCVDAGSNIGQKDLEDENRIDGEFAQRAAMTKRPKDYHASLPAMLSNICDIERWTAVVRVSGYCVKDIRSA